MDERPVTFGARVLSARSRLAGLMAAAALGTMATIVATPSIAQVARVQPGFSNHGLIDDAAYVGRRGYYRGGYVARRGYGYRRGGYGAGAGIAGAAAGAIIGGALAAPYYQRPYGYYQQPYGYGPGPGYYEGY